MGLPVCPQRKLAAEVLNEALTATEVCTALKLLNNNRSSGVCPFPAECLRYAVYKPPDPDAHPVNVLAPTLCSLLNAVFDTGDIPPSWRLSLISPVYKRGPHLHTSSYRPLAVGTPLARLLATLLNQRLSDHLEQNKLLPDSQAAFRPRLSTSHQLFLLQHLINKHAHHRKPLYGLVVDLKSAYDLVVHSVLWELLQRMGVHGKFLRVLQALYDSALIAVKINGQYGAAVHPTVGVRQGCPLSPTLFNIVVSGLNDALLYAAMQHAVDCVPYLTRPQLPVTNLDYADDLHVLACTARALQLLADELLNLR